MLSSVQPGFGGDNLGMNLWGVLCPSVSLSSSLTLQVVRLYNLQYRFLFVIFIMCRELRLGSCNALGMCSKQSGSPHYDFKRDRLFPAAKLQYERNNFEQCKSSKQTNRPNSDYEARGCYRVQHHQLSLCPSVMIQYCPCFIS